MREAEILNYLSKKPHPNIIKSFDSFFSEKKIKNKTFKTFLIILELVEGMTLETKINAEKAMTERTAYRIFNQLLNGVEYLQKMGVFHLDLKVIFHFGHLIIWVVLMT